MVTKMLSIMNAEEFIRKVGEKEVKMLLEQVVVEQ